MDSTNQHYDPLKNIEKAVRSGAKLTSQLLGYARKGKYHVKAINLNQLVRETTDAIGRARKDLIFHLGLCGDLATIEAEQDQIEQVLLNLYVNAADSMPNGGKIIINTLNVNHEDIKSELYDPKPGDYVQLAVEDTGIGMDKRTLEHIFEPFFTTKELGKGTGLGLASVYGIVKSHGGYIEVDSEEGKGTTFTIFLPASTREAHPTVKSAEKIIEGSGTILLVDDEELVLEAGVHMLERLEYRVFSAKNGKEAVEIYEAQAETIDLVILDMIMPGIGGGETFDKLKKINPHVRVLLSSGYSIDGQATDILKRGCLGFIQKPYNLHDLSDKVNKVMINK
jgi:CheY-like chemotaxis protein